jgi:hypothetical protein
LKTQETSASTTHVNEAVPTDGHNHSEGLVRHGLSGWTREGIVATTAEIYDPWKIHTFRDAMESSGAKPPWVIKNLLLSESATLVSAQPHAIKSLSLLSAALEAVATRRVTERLASTMQSCHESSRYWCISLLLPCRLMAIS